MAPLPHPIITLEEAYLSALSRAQSSHLFLAKEIINTSTPNFSSSHIISTTLLPLDVSTAVKVNDEIAQKIGESPPGRFAAFATLPMAYLDEAAQELERCVKELGFLGTLIDSNCGGAFYDDERFWPVFEKAEALDVPIYIHPCPNEEVKKVLYEGNYPVAIATSLSEYAFGWHAETPTSFLCLSTPPPSSLFYRLPRLTILRGYCGEMLPFQLSRTAAVIERQWPHIGGTHKRGFSEVWRENMWVTTSGFFDTGVMGCVVRARGVGRVLFNVDYPFGRNEEGLVDEEDLEKIVWKNAVELLGVEVLGVER
ncbi:hypothetical protein BU23DRAFT_588996 [Bimuria novae-zelandiae CBS 107.79]|uniref:Amidohydrolase-related domain-containing protein n=1 Tax=Bimuria novae-zelandiae CBS 107.79 TaxID=1447943 RepID=A0A6A5VF52_9PLEO|nr:hypothetical protein BU23DRAFT_588996 [Bimuria novae-zelandiae CBS 107.79]